MRSQELRGEEGRAAEDDSAQLLYQFREVRALTLALCEPLVTEDFVIQSMPDVSPPKWHLAHTTWFFETFVLTQYSPEYRPFHPHYQTLFNSYYQGVGQPFQRDRRGMLSRPTVAEIYDYREYVDQALAECLRRAGQNEEISFRIGLGLQHEKQHQELLVTDIKHILAQNPLFPVYRANRSRALRPTIPELTFSEHEGGLVDVGWHGEGFAFDNESPRHRVFLRPFQLANRVVTNGEYRDFIADGGYQRCDLWLSDGWAALEAESWQKPLYWHLLDDEWHEFSLAGLQPLNPNLPVCHLSFYEADAYARWAGCRLPLESEWEVIAVEKEEQGQLLDPDVLHPKIASSPGMTQLFGDVWEWTASAYLPYPGFLPFAGGLGEYNGKFMCNQMVLRGGSCATPKNHIRYSYRNFFYPATRWQFSGIRLAKG